MKFKASYIKIIKKLAIVGVACFFLVVAYKGACALLSIVRGSIVPQTLVVNFQEIYSSTLRDDIERFAHQEFNRQLDVGLNPKEFYKNLKHNFKIVRRAIWNVDSSGCAHLIIRGIKPAF